MFRPALFLALFASLRRNRLVRCDKGITAVEFAMVTPVCILMLMGIIEFSLAMFSLSVMEGATANSSRLGKTGYTAAGSSRQQTIINMITERTSGLLDSNKLSITTMVYTNLNQIGQPEPCISPASGPCSGTPGVNFVDVNGNGQWDSDMGSAGLGNANDVVVYTVSYPWKIFTPMIASIIGNSGIINLKTRAVVKNEPY